MARLRWRRLFRRVLRSIGRPLYPLIGLSFSLIVFVTSIFGNYIVTLFLPMITIANRHRQWREMMDRAITFWMTIPLFFLHFVYGVKVRASGDLIHVDQPAIIIMNHRTRIDWFYFWLVLWRMNPWLMTSNKIALKELLRHVPGAGFGMQASQYVFLKRELNVDSQRMKRAVDYYAAMGRPYQILMFPEGTDKTAYTTERSNEYAIREGLKPLRHLLHPRSAGLIHLVKSMREKNYLNCVYDVTVGYPGELVQNESSMILWGRVAPNVHYHIRRVPAEEIPVSEDGLHHWLLARWYAKDERLERFYSMPRSRRQFELDPEGDQRIWANDSAQQRLVKIFGAVFWMSVVCVWLYHLQFLPFVQIGLVWLLLNYVCIYGCYGGVDELILRRWEKHNETKKKKFNEINTDEKLQNVIVVERSTGNNKNYNNRMSDSNTPTVNTAPEFRNSFIHTSSSSIMNSKEIVKKENITPNQR